MKIHNVRFGLATNSSSSHSIIILNKRKIKKLKDENIAAGDFGWQNFTAVSPVTKLDYAITQLFHNLVATVGEDVAWVVAKEWGSTYFEKTIDGRSYIDHQSVYGLPRDSAYPALPNKEFFIEFANFLLRDDVAILGGNDNDDTPHPVNDGSAFNLPLERDVRLSEFLARKDQKYNFWSLFNPKTGTKFRLSFDNPTDFEPKKATVPELVDLKITSRCPFVNEPCYEYCYQGSDPSKQHGDAYEIRSLLRTLADMGVWEVALGGGEPTFHPDFKSIIRCAKESGIVPNFTTRNLAWLSDTEDRQFILDKIGAFAYSVNSTNQVKKLANLVNLYGIPPEQVSVQLVLGTLGNELYSILAECERHDIRVTLLGYKTTGRGEKQSKNSKDKDNSWVNILSDLNERGLCPQLGIDTVIAEEYLDQLLGLGIPEYLFTVNEGKFSMYVDAVEHQIGPSSYCSKEEMVRLPVSQTGRYSTDVGAFISETFATF